MCVKYVLQINCTDWLFRSNGKVIRGLFKHNFVGLNNMDFLVFLRFFVGVLWRANKGGLCITFEKKWIHTRCTYAYVYKESVNHFFYCKVVPLHCTK